MDNQNQEKISTLPGIGNLFKRAWRIYKERFWTFLGITAIPAISSFLFLIPLTILRISPIFAIFLFVIFGLGVVFLSLWSPVSLLFAIKDREERIGIGESYKRALPKIFPFLWISILTSLITSGGFLLFIIPGLIFSIWFLFGGYVLVWENLKGMDALFRSKQLVSGYWWKVFWRDLAVSLFSFIISLPFSLIRGIAEVLKIPFLGLVKYIPSLFLFPYVTVFVFLIYEDLKKLKEGILFEPPKKGRKIKYILIGLLGFLLISGILFGIVFTSLSGARSKARDAKREADVGQFSTAMKMKYEDDLSGARSKARDAKREADVGQFSTAMKMKYEDDLEYPLTSVDPNGRLTITGIRPYLDSLPRDPGGGKIKNCNDLKDGAYKAFDNSSDRQKYCIWACLEKGGFIAASKKGVNYLDIPPLNLNCQ